MTENITDAMKAKAKTATRFIDLEAVQDLRQRVEDVQDAIASMQILVREVTDMEEFKPPIVRAFIKVGRRLSQTSQDMSTTAQLLEGQAQRITMVAEDVLALRKAIVIGILLCSAPSLLTTMFLAWRAGLL